MCNFLSRFFKKVELLNFGKPLTRMVDVVGCIGCKYNMPSFRYNTVATQAIEVPTYPPISFFFCLSIFLQCSIGMQGRYLVVFNIHTFVEYLTQVFHWKFHIYFSNEILIYVLQRQLKMQTYHSLLRIVTSFQYCGSTYQSSQWLELRTWMTQNFQTKILYSAKDEILKLLSR